MIFVCSVCVRASERVSVYMHCIHSIVFQSTGKYSNYFTFRAKFFIYFLAITIGGEVLCVYISLHAPAQTLSPHSFSLSLFFSLFIPLARSLDADIINIRLVICFPKYFMQCCVYSSISERLVYSLFVCFVSFRLQL